MLRPGRGSVRQRGRFEFKGCLLVDTTAIARLIEPAVKELGFDLVRVAMIGGSSDPTLQVMAERPDTRQLTIDDCTDISRSLSDLLDAEEAAGRDPVEGGYRLEVSSPGIDRPLVRASDFQRWAGHEAKIEMTLIVAGRRKFRGILLGAEGGKAKIRRTDAHPGEATDIELRVDDMSEAHLILTDALVTESLRRAKAASKALAAELEADETETDPVALERAAPRNR